LGLASSLIQHTVFGRVWYFSSRLKSHRRITYGDMSWWKWASEVPESV
jgi:hypothetical protein